MNGEKTPKTKQKKAQKTLLLFIPMGPVYGDLWF